MIQFVHEGHTSYVAADFPDDAFQQIKAASVQRQHKEATTREALLAAIPEAAIHPTSFIRPVAGKSGTLTPSTARPSTSCRSSLGRS